MNPFRNKMVVIKIQHFEEQIVVTINDLSLEEFLLKE